MMLQLQQAKQSISDIFLSSHNSELLLEDPKVFLGQMEYVVILHVHSLAIYRI